LSLPGATYPTVPFIAIEEVEFESPRDNAVGSTLNLAHYRRDANTRHFKTPL